jgi:hypothetical protein
MIAGHRYTPIIESLPVASPIWTATLIGVIGDIQRFTTYREFKAYMGWYPQTTSSGTSVDASRLARSGVWSGRRVFGQMAVLLLAPTIRDTPFRVAYQRWTRRGMPAATALGHLAGKLCSVLYGMLKTMTPYDEARHRRELGLAPVHTSEFTTIAVSMDAAETSTLDPFEIESTDTAPSGHCSSESASS